MLSEKSSSKSVPSSTGRFGGQWFYPTLFRKNLSRFWPLWGLYLTIWAFLLPLALYSNAPWNEGEAHWPDSYILDLIRGGVPLIFFFGLFFAMAVFSYLYNPRSVGTIHALPVRREGLFLTNWLSGFSFLLLPHGVVFLLTLGVELLIGQLALWPVTLWFLSMTLIGLFFYSFGVFCAMFTGNLLALPIFYGILNFLVIGLTSLFDLLARQFLFGYSYIDSLSTVSYWFTPVLNLIQNVRSNYGIAQNAGPLVGFHYILIYALVGLLLTVLALLVYRKRHLETAGDVVSVPWVRPVFKFGVAFCSAVFLGTLIYQMLFAAVTTSLVLRLVLFMVLMGLVGYYAAEMLLHKSFRVFRQSWKGAVGFTLVLLLCTAALEFDLFGYESRVPAADSVKSVSIYGVDSKPYDSAAHMPITTEDPEEIAAILQLHSTIVGDRRQLERSDPFTVSAYESGHIPQYQEQTVINLHLDYVTTSNELIQRQYMLPITSEQLGQPDTYAAQLEAFLNRSSIAEQLYLGDILEQEKTFKLFQAAVNNSYSTDPETHEVFDSLNIRPITGDTRLLEAIRSDLAAGRLGVRFLLNSEERYETCYYNDLTLYFLHVRPSGDSGDDGSPQAQQDTVNVTITLQPTATETIAELERLGLVDEEHPLLTHQQMEELTFSSIPSTSLSP